MATSSASGTATPAPSVFDLRDETEGLDWASIYFYVGLAASAACEAVDNLHLLGIVHESVKYDSRVWDALAQSKELRELLQDLAASAYARSREQQRDGEGGAA